MKVYTQEEWQAEARELFGDDPKNWRFKCSSSRCGREQSYNSLIQQFEKGIKSQRYGIPEQEDGNYKVNPYTACYGPDCNWVAGGLFSSGIIVVYDSTKPYDTQRMENCVYVFPFAEPRKCRLCGYNLDKNEPDNETDLCTQCQEGEAVSEEWEKDNVIGWGSLPPGAKRK